MKPVNASPCTSEIELTGKLLADWNGVVNWLHHLNLLRGAGVAAFHNVPQTLQEGM
jgi:hypothetical protein